MSKANPFVFLLLVVVKIFHLPFFNQTHQSQLRICPVDVNKFTPEIKDDLTSHIEKITSMQYQLLFIDGSVSTVNGAAAYFKKSEIVMQVVIARYKGKKVVMTNFMTFLKNGRVLSTCDDRPGISNGGMTEIILINKASIDNLEKNHLRRYQSTDSFNLSPDEILNKLEELARYSFDYNESRGVFHMV